jgi:hypothetical protein
MSVSNLIYLAAQAQSAAPPNPVAAPSPEVLKAITDLMNAVAGHPPKLDSQSWASPEGLKAITGLIVSLAWPLLVGVVFYRFSPQVTAFLNRMNKVELFGVKVEIEAELSKSAEQAAVTLSRAPSQDELDRADKVEKIAKQDVVLVRQEVDALALEYENTRALMPSGDKRTRRMEVVVSKMRTVGRVAYAIRYELIESPSPGRRLQAVACLQVIPDYELLDWLASRVRAEKPFIGYHAVIAMIWAARDAHAREHVKAIEAAYQKAKGNAHELPPTADRVIALSELQQQIALLQATTK